MEPTQGTLAVSGTQQLSVEFLGSTLGEFCELVDVELDGSNERLTCQFKGHVIGPTFHFDVDVVEYGLCSFALAHERTLELTNTADIGMDFILKIPQDGQYGAPEFLLEPSSGSLAPRRVGDHQGDLHAGDHQGLRLLYCRRCPKRGRSLVIFTSASRM